MAHRIVSAPFDLLYSEPSCLHGDSDDCWVRKDPETGLGRSWRCPGHEAGGVRRVLRGPSWTAVESTLSGRDAR